MISVLLVDEEPEILDLTRKFLGRAGDIRVTSALSVQEALEKIDDEKFDVIVSDYDMPVTNGIEFLKILKSRGDETPFIVFTGKGREQVAMEALNNGADYYLQKGGDPRIQFAELQNMISKANRERWAAQALRESERRFREMLENIRMIAIQIDLAGIITYCNEYLVDLSGWRREEITGKNWFELFIPDDDRDRLRAVFDAVLVRSQSYLYCECPVLTKSGECRYIAWNNTLLRDAGGMVTGMSSIGEDVTERRRAEAVRAMLAAIVQSSDDAIIGEDLDGRITSWNAGAERLYGYKPDEIIGRNLKDLLPSKDASARKEIIGKIKNGERVEHFETERMRKDGTIVTVSLSVSPILGPDHKITGIANIARDLTRQRETEKAFIGYITEAALRLKNPIEQIGSRLADISKQIGDGEVPEEAITLQLQTQIRNIEQVLRNLNELNRVILEDVRNVPEAYRRYLTQ